MRAWSPRFMNNRELATVILAGLVILLIVIYPKTRSSLPQLVRLLLSPKIVGPLLIYALGMTGLVWLAWRVGLWVPDLLTDTVFWFFLTGLAWFFNINKAGQEEHFIRDRVIKTVGVAAF